MPLFISRRPLLFFFILHVYDLFIAYDYPENGIVVWAVAKQLAGTGPAGFPALVGADGCLNHGQQS